MVSRTDNYQLHNGNLTLFNQAPAFTAGVVILLNIWGNKRSGRTADVERNLADYQHCMDALKHGANRSVYPASGVTYQREPNKYTDGCLLEDFGEISRIWFKVQLLMY